jgi:hypothetical protein
MRRIKSDLPFFNIIRRFNLQTYTVYLYLETAPHVSDGTSTHHQEPIQLYLQRLVFVTPYCYLPLSWKSWNRFECAVGGVPFVFKWLSENKQRVVPLTA